MVPKTLVGFFAGPGAAAVGVFFGTALFGAPLATWLQSVPALSGVLIAALAGVMTFAVVSGMTALGWVRSQIKLI